MELKGPSSRAEATALAILCVGLADRSEFREVLPSLKAWGTVIEAPNTREAVSQLGQESLTPDVIIIVQSYPGEFTDAQIDELRWVAPLARLVAVLGTWCEGEMRSGTPWSGAVRVYWHQWAPHCQQELKRLVEGRESLWSLPPTACEEERCLAIAARPKPKGGGLVEIVTEQYDIFDWLAAACRDRGYEPRWRRSGDEAQTDAPVVVLFDAAGEMAAELARFRRLQIARDATAIILADFPRIAACDRFVRAGARAVLSRPFFWNDLFWYFPANPLRGPARGGGHTLHGKNPRCGGAETVI